MNNKKSIQEILEEINETKAFDKLKQFTENKKWQSLKESDRLLLAELLILQGESYLEAGDDRVLSVFEIVREISPDDAFLFYIQGVVLANAKDNSLYVNEACHCFAKATTIDPTCFEAWFLWAKLLLQQGEEFEDEKLVHEAEKLFACACQYRPEDEEIEANFYWHWGMADCYLGRIHGEAVDFKKAMNKCSIAASLGLHNSDFWEHFGHITCELGSLVNQVDSLREGRAHFQKACEIDPENGSALISLAFCDQKLYEVFANPVDFKNGIASFEAALKYNQRDGQFWCRWGILLLLYGRLNIDMPLLEESFEKFKIAYDCEPDNPMVLAKWAEAEMVYGIYSERIDYLKQAEAKIVNSLKLQDNSSENWYIYGTCLCEIGRYFGDANYYLQAIEKFQYGLFLTPKDMLLLQGIAAAYYSAGEIRMDIHLLEQSLAYSKSAIQNAKEPSPQFWNDWGVTLMKMAEVTNDKSYLESAVEKFEKTFILYEENPENLDPEWLYNYGCALDFLGDFFEDSSYYEKSIQYLNKFIQLDPSYIHAHYNLASAYSHLGELVGDVDCFYKAIEHYQDFVTIDNEDEMVWNDYGLTLLNLAELLHDPSLPNLSQDCFTRAEEKFMIAISLGCSVAFYNLACLYSLTGHFHQALHYMEKAEKNQSLPSLEEIMEDEWLENLHNTTEFRLFLSNLTEKDRT